MKTFITLFLFSSIAYGWDVDSKKLFTNNSIITITVVKNIRERCEKESKSRNLGGFGYSMEACSFWTKKEDKDVCSIFLKEHAIPDDLAHEVYHCFAGQWH